MDWMHIFLYSGGGLISAVVIFVIKSIWDNENFRSALEAFFDSSIERLPSAEAYFKAIQLILDDITFLSRNNKRIVLYLNFGLVSAMSKIVEEIKGASSEEKKATTIVGVMLQDRLKKSTIAQSILILSLAINFILSLLFAINFSNFLFIFVAVSIFSIQLDQKLIDYRVRKGWYGKNEFEAKEIINFIVSHANKDDFNDDGGLKKVIPLPEIEFEKEKFRSTEGVTA